VSTANQRARTSENSVETGLKRWRYGGKKSTRFLRIMATRPRHNAARFDARIAVRFDADCGPYRRPIAVRSRAQLRRKKRR
jgi:hypothetical protein